MDLSTHHAVIYDPQRAIVVVPSLQTGGSDVLLPTGNVLISDGAAAALYDPTTDRALPQIPPAPPIPATILLEDGRALSLGNTCVVYTAQPYQNPEPVIAAVMSNTPASNSEPISLDIRGSSFLPNSFVQLGPTNLVTLYLGARRLVAFVPPHLHSSLNSGITISTPAPGGGTTSAVGDGIVQSQAGILPTPLTTSTAIMVDVLPAAGRSLGIAIANADSTPALVTLALRDPEGQPAGSLVSITIPARGQLARFVTELFPSAAAGGAFLGSVDIQSSIPVSIIALRSPVWNSARFRFQ